MAHSSISPFGASGSSRAARKQVVQVNYEILTRICFSERSQQCYLKLQRRGEEPDLIITRSFAQASLFALDDEDEEDQTGGN
jgi:hypothetical protein